MSAPNFVFIMVDQMRGDCLGADGNGYIDTPHLDCLASCGTRFNHAYSAVPSCIPARACLMTGQNQWNAGILGMGWGQCHMPNDYPHTLAGEMSKAGYTTHMIGKGHFHPYHASMGFNSMELEESSRLQNQGILDSYRSWFYAQVPSGVTFDDHGVGFNSWLARPWHQEERLHQTAWTATRAIDFLARHDKSKPFFLNVSFARPHSPYVPPQCYWDRYIDAELPEPVVGDWAAMHDDPTTAVDTDAWRGKMKDRDIRRARAGYFGEISFIDSQIGRFISAFRRQYHEAFANTWFIFTSDHGDMQGDHNLWRKTYAYEGSARIPFLVVPPSTAGKPACGVCDKVVELRDVMPTVLAAAGVEIPKTVDGQSVLPLLAGQDVDWRKYLHGEHCRCYHDHNEMHYVTDGRRKLIWFPRTGQEQFFDLEQDPGELRDLAADSSRKEDVALWRGYLTEELAARDCGWVKDGKPFCIEGEPLVSPYRDKRRVV